MENIQIIFQYVIVILIGFCLFFSWETIVEQIISQNREKYSIYKNKLKFFCYFLATIFVLGGLYAIICTIQGHPPATPDTKYLVN